MLKSIIKDSAFYLIPSLITRGMGIILIPLYSRVLSASDYGSFDLLIAFSVLVNLTIAFEVIQGLSRFYSDASQDDKVTYASSAFLFTIFCYSSFFFLSFFFANEVSFYVMGQSGMDLEFKVGLAYIYFNGIFYLIQNQFRWELRSYHYAVVSSIVCIATALLGIAFTCVWKFGLIGLILAMALGAFVGCIYGLWYLKDTLKFRFSPKKLKDMLVFSFPLVPSSLAVYVSQYIDRIMINHYSTLDQVGIFGMGFRLAGIAGIVIIGLQGSLTPFIYANHTNPEMPKQLAKLFRMFVAFALLFFVSLSLFSREVFELFTVSPYYSASTLLIYLVPAIFLSNMYIFAPGASIMKKTQIILWVNLAGAILNVLINMLFIPSFGVEGASIAKLISCASVFLGYMVNSQKLYYVPHDWWAIIRTTIIIFILAYSFQSISNSFLINFVIKLMVILVSAGLIFHSGLIKHSELRHINKLFDGKFFKRKIKV